MEYGAIDLHTKESEIRIIDEAGAVVFERRIATTRTRLTEVFGRRTSLRILLALRPSGHRAPVFCVHPAIGLAWCYTGFVPHLADHPVYGLQSPGLSSNSACSGLRPTPSAPKSSASSIRFSRSVKSPMPQLRIERTP